MNKFMTRDKRKDEAYFSMLIHSIQGKNDERRKLYLEKENPTKIAYFMVATGLCPEFSQKYSYGETIENLKTIYNQILDYYIASIEEDEVYNVTLKVISLRILLDADREKLHQLYKLIQQCKQNDLIFSSLLHPVLQTNEVYSKLCFKRSRSSLMLEKILVSSKKEDAEILLKEYLEKFWHTKENLDHDYDPKNSAGLWAWDAAAIVKILKLDDSGFKDNEFYPYDLVHWNE
jgi:hypothetical protein